MFFRRTKVANGPDGKSYYTYRLVENQREGTKTRQKTMLNLGANWDVPQSDWKAVAQRVEAIQQRQISCFEYPKHVESAAQSIVNRLRARDLNGDKPATGSVVTVDLDTMKHTDVRSVGCERLCLQALEDLQLSRTLEELGMSELDTRRALALVAAKMIHPASERETSRWIKDNSSLPEFLDLTRSRDLERKTLYRIGDCLWKRQAEIEKHLFRRERDLLNIPATIVFYDLSNTHCTGQHHDQGLRRFGRSKQRRNDCPLVTLALVLDEKGFPRSSEVLPGNVGEAKTLEAALKNLEEVHGCRDPNNRPTVIMDAGISTDDNLKGLSILFRPYQHLVVMTCFLRHFVEIQSYLNKMDKPLTSSFSRKMATTGSASQRRLGRLLRTVHRIARCIQRQNIWSRRGGSLTRMRMSCNSMRAARGGVRQRLQSLRGGGANWRPNCNICMMAFPCLDG